MNKAKAVWNQFIDELNQILTNPPEGCDPLPELPQAEPCGKISKQLLQDVIDRLNQMSGNCFSFPTLGECLKMDQETVDMIRNELGNVWCDCEGGECPLIGYNEGIPEPTFSGVVHSYALNLTSCGSIFERDTEALDTLNEVVRCFRDGQLEATAEIQFKSAAVPIFQEQLDFTIALILQTEARIAELEQQLSEVMGTSPEAEAQRQSLRDRIDTAEATLAELQSRLPGLAQALAGAISELDQALADRQALIEDKSCQWQGALDALTNGLFSVLDPPEGVNCKLQERVIIQGVNCNDETVNQVGEWVDISGELDSDIQDQVAAQFTFISQGGFGDSFTTPAYVLPPTASSDNEGDILDPSDHPFVNYFGQIVGKVVGPPITTPGIRTHFLEADVCLPPINGCAQSGFKSGTATYEYRWACFELERTVCREPVVDTGQPT